MSNFNREHVTHVVHWTDSLFSFRTSRDQSFRFESGQFTMLGLEIDGKPLMRAYSLASAHYEDELEFFSIKVPDGPLTSRLQHLKEGDTVLVGRKPTGTLVHHNLLPGKRLYLLGTGTGLAPFLSVIKDPEVYERFEHVILVHGCRQVAELAYGELINKRLPEDEIVGDFVKRQLIYYPTVTREPFVNRGRITDLISSGRLFRDVNMPAFDRENDRVEICGSPEMVKDLRACLNAQGFSEGAGNRPGHFVVEKAFADA